MLFVSIGCAKVGDRIVIIIMDRSCDFQWRFVKLTIDGVELFICIGTVHVLMENWKIMALCVFFFKGKLNFSIAGLWTFVNCDAFYGVHNTKSVLKLFLRYWIFSFLISRRLNILMKNNRKLFTDEKSRFFWQILFQIAYSPLPSTQVSIKFENWKTDLWN